MGKRKNLYKLQFGSRETIDYYRHYSQSDEERFARDVKALVAKLAFQTIPRVRIGGTAVHAAWIEANEPTVACGQVSHYGMNPTLEPMNCKKCIKRIRKEFDLKDKEG